jgi:hypothetical protein
MGDDYPEIRGRENDESEFLVFPAVDRPSLPKHMVIYSKSRAAVDLFTNTGESGAIRNRDRDDVGTRPLGSTVEKDYPRSKLGEIPPPSFQHVLVGEYMRGSNGFDPRRDKQFWTLQNAYHGDFSSTGKILERVIPARGGIDVVLASKNLPAGIENEAWGSPEAHNAFSSITDRDVKKENLPDYIAQMSTKDENVRIIDVEKVRRIASTLDNPVVIKHAIQTALSDLHSNYNGGFGDKFIPEWKRQYADLESIALKPRRVPAYKASMQIIDEEFLDNNGKMFTFGTGDACNFLLRVRKRFFRNVDPLDDRTAMRKLAIVRFSNMNCKKVIGRDK